MSDKKLRSGQFNIDVEEKPLLWTDRKRWLGMPITFTRYTLNEEKLLVNTGLISLNEEEVLLYRIQDISVRQSLGERLFGVGTICISSTDVTVPHLELLHVKNPSKVKDVVSKCVAASRRRNKIHSTELMDADSNDPDDNDYDGDACSFVSGDDQEV